MTKKAFNKKVEKIRAARKKPALRAK